MKKINFKNLSSEEILTRDELKKISGGYGSGCGICTKYNVTGPPVKSGCVGETIRGTGGTTMLICSCNMAGGGDCE